MGESLGLKWSDIDLEAGTLRVNRQLQRMREGGGLVFSEPKNASRRTIDFPQRALEALRTHRKHQLEEKLRASSYQDSDLVFATRKDPPLDAQNIVNRHFKPLLKRAGLPLFARTISGTPAPPCFWGAAYIRNWSSTFLGTPA